MAETFQFDSRDTRKPQCIACDQMLADALDQTLNEADRTWFDRHIDTCAECSQRMADAQRGAAWLEMLKAPRPEPSALLMERILAQTSGTQAPGIQTTGLVARPVVAASARLLPFRIPLPRFNKPWLEPRLAMTAAMAFFSVALTLNLAGVKLNELHASDLKPESLKRTYYQANAGVSRYYDNLRVVHVMESRVEDMREANSDSESQSEQAQPERPQPDSKPEAPATPDDKDTKPAPPKGPGISRRESPLNAPHLLFTSRSSARGATVNRKSEPLKGGLA